MKSCAVKMIRFLPVFPVIGPLSFELTNKQRFIKLLDRIIINMLFYYQALVLANQMGSRHPLGCSIGPRSKMSHFVLKKIAGQKSKQAALHPGPVLPPSVEGSPFACQ